MYIIVRNNNIERAMRELKKRLNRDGLFAELKERRFYDKPSVKKKKKRIKAEKRKLKKSKIRNKRLNTKKK